MTCWAVVTAVDIYYFSTVAFSVTLNPPTATAGHNCNGGGDTTLEHTHTLTQIGRQKLSQ